MTFVDFKKTFDTVEISATLIALKECRIDYRHTNSIYNIYKNVTSTIHLHKITQEIEIKRGVRQDDTLSPRLFTTVLEHAFKTPN